MIKKYAMNKIVVMSLVFGLLLLFYLVPTPSFDVSIVENGIKNENVVYLLDDDNYVSRVITYYDKDNIEDVIKEKINILINGSKELNKFYSLIPKHTILKDIEIEKDNVYLNFSKELLNVNKYLEESMIEAIVFSITEINGINNVYINVDGEKLLCLPNSKKELSYPLTRKFGINKKYDLDNFNNIDSTIIFFSKSIDDYNYYVPVTKISNANSSKIDIIIEELKSSVNAQDNLNSFISSNVVLIDSDIVDNKLNLVFNEYIFNSNVENVILEEVKYIISKSVFENIDVDEVVFNTNEKKNIAYVKK